MNIKIDLSYLENMSAGDNNLIKEMIDIFKEQVPEFISEMEMAIKNNDSKAMASVAHKAKSSAAIIGITELADFLKTLEKLASNNERTNEYPEFLKYFENISNESIKQLDKIYKEL